MTRGSALWAAALLTASASAQQAPDPDFKPSVSHPAYEAGHGPVVMIDEAHFNFHTAGGRYRPFAELLRKDGYTVEPFKEPLTAASLKNCRILVIANALSEDMAQDWNAPAQSAFTGSEIESVRKWVQEGGSLFLIVDHMPMPGAAEKLAAAFGVQSSNGYAQDPVYGGTIVFKRSDGSLADHPITSGRNSAEKIESVVTFAGSAFQAATAVPLLTFKRDAVSWLTKRVGQLGPDTPQIGVKNWQQGAVLQMGKGRVAVFGEAAMFTAQLAGPDRVPMGMNAAEASQNPQFLLNIAHWLSGLL